MRYLDANGADVQLLAAMDGVVTVEGSHRLSDVARQVECSVFFEFFHNDPELMAAEYAPYEEASVFFVAVLERQIAGVLRVIRHSAAGFKTLADLEVTPFEMELHHSAGLQTCWDVATLAVPKAYRGDQAVSAVLYGALYTEALRQQVDHVITILDDHAHRQLVDVFGVPFVPLAGRSPCSYLGSVKSHPVYLHVPSAWQAIAKTPKLVELTRTQVSSRL